MVSSTKAQRHRGTKIRLQRRTILCGLTVLLTWMAPQAAQAYIGPGAGLVVVGSFFVMILAFLSAFLALLTWPIRYLIRSIRYQQAFKRAKIRKLVILGLDGLEPSITERFLAEGKLPNLAKLKEQGCYRKLGTVLPPLSPVAWSTFQTGCNPGKHNIFDFLTRDKRSYYPRLSSTEIGTHARELNLGLFKIPLGRTDSYQLLRKGVPFWKILGDHGIFSNVIRVPITFPPEKFYGVSLSAMCVPDLRGTQGTFSYFTTRSAEMDIYEGGERIRVERNGKTISTELIGPSIGTGKQKKTLICPFTVQFNGKPDQAELRVSGSTVKLRKGEYTDWVTVKFKVSSMSNQEGICQFLLLDNDPDFDLYVTPIHLSPYKPAMPIAHPFVYSAYLAKRQGPYATLGLAEDSWALNERIINERAFLHQCVIADEEREEMFFDALSKVQRGVCVCVFDGTDRIQHTFWRYLDPDHPVNRTLGDQQNEKVIEELYMRMDGIVGKTMKKCDEDTVLMVISDHGFNGFRHGLDLNRWLEENGYLTLKPDGRGKKFLEGVDWSQTRAFAVGLAGIYLNIKGREAQGIVSEGNEAHQLRREIAEKLAGTVHPSSGDTAVLKVYNALEDYSGPYRTEAPDLIIGYNKLFRVSWETAIGQVTDSVFHDNTKSWAGDHCIDPRLIPGVIFCNRNIADESPRLMDLAPTALNLVGVDVPPHMDGKSLNVSVSAQSNENQPAAKGETPDLATAGA